MVSAQQEAVISVLKLIQFKTPKGGNRRPTFYSRRLYPSVCRRTQSIRRRRNVKGNFAWGSYGGFLAGSWRILGGTLASSRRTYKLPKAAEQTAGGKPKGSQDGGKAPKRVPTGVQRHPKTVTKTSLYSQRVLEDEKTATSIHFCSFGFISDPFRSQHR